MAKFTDLRTAVLVGGDSLEVQFEELANNPDIIVATPGRLLHHLAEVGGRACMCTSSITPSWGEITHWIRLEQIGSQLKVLR
jgi:hypothetical protein